MLRPIEIANCFFHESRLCQSEVYKTTLPAFHSLELVSFQLILYNVVKHFKKTLKSIKSMRFSPINISLC